MVFDIAHAYEMLAQRFQKRVHRDEILAHHSSFGVGGPADLWVSLVTKKELTDLVRLCAEQHWSLLVVGDGSNILYADEGVRGIVARVALHDYLVTEQADGSASMEAEAGVRWTQLLHDLVPLGWGGLEFGIGIPGTLGAGLVSNAGAHHQALGEAVEWIEASVPDLVLLDVMMPKMDGYTVCQKVREFSSVPIIIITARGQDQEKVRGLDLGADDYLTKPFSIEELLARIRAVLRRTQFSAGDHSAPIRSTTTIGELTIDDKQHLVTMAGREITLTPTEYRLLAYLTQNVGRIVTQDLLLEHIWSSEYTGESHMLQVNVNRLRRKIEPDPAHPRYILTKVGIGYLFANQDKTTAPPKQ